MVQENHGLAEATLEIHEMRDGMLQMALLIREMNERMAELEKTLRDQVKVTPAQASAINREIRKRATELCRMYSAEGGEHDTILAIRRSLKATCGAGCVRDLRRCDYELALKAVRIWEDYRAMNRIKAKKGGKP